jgi:DNA-binding NtrC family response regulator
VVDPETVRVASKGTPVRGIRAEVTAGPDTGQQKANDEECLRIGTAEGNDLVLTDGTVSRFHVTLRRRGDRITVTDHESTNGTRIGDVELRNATVSVRPGTNLQLGESVVHVDDGAVVMLDRGPEVFGELRGRDDAMQRLFATAARVAGSDVSVLILGESGTGKELLARAIHDHSPRAEHPFVTLDCAAVSPNLFESELFGHERGAFTGADQRHIGAVERAHQGTLFLDEIAELPPTLQASLLGVLERRRFRRVGGNQELPVDVRVLSATNRDLHAEVNAGTFRLDLFYRLAMVRLSIPPLRERRQDVPLLLEHMLATAGYREPLETLFSRDELKRLMTHAWPGNVRELRNVALGTLALGEAPALMPMPDADSDPIEAVLPMSYRAARQTLVEKFERRYLEALLERAGGNIRQAARDGEMNRSYLMELLRRHGMR